MLSIEEVSALLARAQNGDEEAKATLIESNSPLIKSIIRRYRNKGVEYEDLYQLGCIGFLKAIKNYSAVFNVKFTTYAVPMIAGEIKRFMRDDGYIKVSRSIKTLAIRISYFVEDYKKRNGTEPRIESIAENFGVEAEDAVFAMDSSKIPLSLYEKTDDEHSQTLMDKISSGDPTDDNLDKLVLSDMIGKLDGREKKIIMLRFFRDCTQSEVAKVLNISQVQVSRLETKIIAKMKEGFI